MKSKLILILFLAANVFINAQGSAGSSAKFEYRNLIDLPSAGVLEKGYVGVGMNVLPFGTVISKIEVGVFKNFSFGISFGGTNVIGTGEIDWYKLPGINVRARILNESLVTPALAVGFDSQGKGKYYSDTKRYDIKSPGFFAAVSKNFQFLGYLSLHGMVNYSLEREDDDKDLNLGIGVEKTLGEVFSIIMEYDFAINDNTGNSLGDGNGYLNMGVRWSVTGGFTIGLDLRDLLANKKFVSNKADRGIFVEFINPVF